MILTADDMYKAFLDGIKKEYTGVVRPDQFNRIVNEWGQMPWLKSKVALVEFNSKVIMDIQPVVITPETHVVANNQFLLTSLTHRIYRPLGLSVKVQYGPDDPCDRTGTSDWIYDVHVMRSDRRTVVKKSSFRRPTADKVYYQIASGSMHFDCGSGNQVVTMALEYARYPLDIVWSSTGTHVNSEFGPEQNSEIVDTLVKAYLENVGDPRYQSFLNEYSQKN